MLLLKFSDLVHKREINMNMVSFSTFARPLGTGSYLCLALYVIEYVCI